MLNIELPKLLESLGSAVEGHLSSRDYSDFMQDAFLNFFRLYGSLTNKTFVCSSYAFIIKIPKPREVFACKVELRVVHHYIAKILIPILERLLSPNTYNNRIGMGTLKSTERVHELMHEVSLGFTKKCWIIKLDISGFFPNAVRAVVYEQVKDLIDKYYDGDDIEVIHYLLELSLLTDPTENCSKHSPEYEWELIEKYKSLFDKPDGIGGAIGYLSWQISMNYYIHEVDELLDSYGIKFVRFVDDICIITDNKEFVLSIIPEIRLILQKLGCRLSEHKFYCQQVTHGVEYLGYHLKPNRKYTNNRIIRRIYLKINYLNKHIDEDHINEFISSMNSYFSILKRSNSSLQTLRLLLRIDHRWNDYLVLDDYVFKAKPGYKYDDLLTKKYHIKLHNYGSVRKIKRIKC